MLAPDAVYPGAGVSGVDSDGIMLRISGKLPEPFPLMKAIQLAVTLGISSKCRSTGTKAGAGNLIGR